MTDLDRYLTDEVVEKAARAEWEYEWADRSWERTPDDFRDFYISVARASLSAVLPGIIRQAKAGVLRDFAATDARTQAEWERATARADRIEQGGQP